MAERDPAVIGARIAKRRHQLDMTQIELAEALDVSPSTVANWERGISYPARKMGKIEELLGDLGDEAAPPAASEEDLIASLEAQAAEIQATARRMRAERERRQRARGAPEDGEGEQRRA